MKEASDGKDLRSGLPAVQGDSRSLVSKDNRTKANGKQGEGKPKNQVHKFGKY